jgi:SpoVK/Ycf46/Vps4 family AAA+-type ATPase
VLNFFIVALALIVFLQELDVPFISISAPSIVSGMSGESEKTLRDTFDEAKVYISLLDFTTANIRNSVLHPVYYS